MYRRFDADTYRAESAAWNVEKFVNVAAATGRNSVDETLELDRNAAAQGGPAGIIGGLPPTETVAEAVALLDRQMAAARFRGVRPMGPLDNPVPDDAVLGELRDRELVFELMAHPDQLEVAAARLAAFPDLTVVVEHTGWPRANTDEERARWRAGISALAALGAHVVCKLSGLSMPFGSMEVDVVAPWFEFALDAFGADRCMFASNFPVDSAAGSFDDLYALLQRRHGRARRGVAREGLRRDRRARVPDLNGRRRTTRGRATRTWRRHSGTRTPTRFGSSA